MSRVWLITGASSGLGLAIVKEALLNGDKVVATSRRDNAIDIKNDNFMYLKLDVKDKDSCHFQDVVNKTIDKFGTIDVLVNNAGHGMVTNFEETSDESIRELFETNVFGMMKMTRVVLLIMRKNRSGHIFNVSSGAGYAPGPVGYHTSKFAVTGFSTSLKFEVEQFGIKVTNIIPGMFRTEFYNENKWVTNEDNHISDYDKNRWQTSLVETNRKHNQIGNPEKLAKLVYEVSTVDNPPLHLPVGVDTVETLNAWIDSIKKDNDEWKEKASKTSY